MRAGATLVATLGTEPQVVTLTLDALLARGEGINRVVVVHTDPGEPAIAVALRSLAAEGPFYRDRGVVFDYVPVQGRAGVPRDLVGEEEVEAAFRTLYRVVREAKKGGRRVHLSIAGGRKVLAAFGMAVAQLLLGPGDEVWHLLSEGGLLRSRRMHARQGEGVALVPVPFIPWSALAPGVAELVLREDPWAAMLQIRAWQERGGWAQARLFLDRELTGAEKMVVELLVATGFSNQELARKLHLSPKTVANRISTAREKARSFFGLEQVDRARLVALLTPAVNRFPPVGGTVSLVGDAGRG